MRSDIYSAPESKTELIKCGTFLKCYCPHCNLSLTQGEDAVFDVVNNEGETGEVRLSPYLCIFNRRSTISLPEGQTVKDIICPYCQKSLLDPDDECAHCGTPVARILIAALTKIIPFHICTMVGCHWHGLSDEDENTIRLDDCNDW
jgi:hypothetical protein